MSNWVEDAMIEAIDRRASLRRQQTPSRFPRVVRYEEPGASFEDGRIIVRGARGMPRLVVVESRSAR